MFFFIHHFIGGIELRMFIKRRNVKDADVVCWHDIRVQGAFLQVVEEPAEGDEGTVIPVTLRPDLEFDVDHFPVVEQDLDVEDKILVADVAA